MLTVFFILSEPRPLQMISTSQTSCQFLSWLWGFLIFPFLRSDLLLSQGSWYVLNKNLKPAANWLNWFAFTWIDTAVKIGEIGQVYASHSKPENKKLWSPRTITGIDYDAVIMTGLDLAGKFVHYGFKNSHVKFPVWSLTELVKWATDEFMTELLLLFCSVLMKPQMIIETSTWWCAWWLVNRGYCPSHQVFWSPLWSAAVRSIDLSLLAFNSWRCPGFGPRWEAVLSTED